MHQTITGRDFAHEYRDHWHGATPPPCSLLGLHDPCLDRCTHAGGLLVRQMDGPATTRPSAYRIAQVTGLSGTYVRRIGSGR